MKLVFMENLNELFFSASVEELVRGYAQRGEDYICLLCGETTTQGIIYESEGMFCDAQRFLRTHIESAHGSVFEALIGFDKRLTGLTDHQCALMKRFYQNKSDAQIQLELCIGSASTIRNHRFALREKERQAKVFLVLMELLRQRDTRTSREAPPTESVLADARSTAIGIEDEGKILSKYFPHGADGPLLRIPSKEKHRIAVLRALAERFVPGEVYTEKQVNELLAEADDDFVTLRRYLIEYGFLIREPDGSAYWLAERETEGEQATMDRKKELIRQYKEMKTVGGVYQVRNTVNGKVLIVSTPNLRTLNGRRADGFLNPRLREDVNQYGLEAFVIEVLEELEQKNDLSFDFKRELKRMEEKWMDQLQPYGDKGYNFGGSHEPD